MKRTHFIFGSIFLLGFIFEYLYFSASSTFFSTKLWLIGVVCIIVGTLGLWVTAILPFINDKMEGRKT